MLGESGISELEFIQLWNLTPRDYTEAVALIPSLSHNYPQEAVNTVLDKLNEKRK